MWGGQLRADAEYSDRGSADRRACNGTKHRVDRSGAGGIDNGKSIRNVGRWRKQNDYEHDQRND